ncbi:MAG: signal recognition particle-docking protein FtsY [Gammaproteobacteria bacterium]
MNDTTSKRGFFGKLKDRFSQGKGLGFKPVDWLRGKPLDDALADDLEDQLLMADVGVSAAARIIDGLRKHLGRQAINESDARGALREVLLEIATPRVAPLQIPADTRPYLILMIGVNGSGKTTTIGKLARHFKTQGLSVMLAAGDTYRAAAIEQLQAWGDRNEVPVISQQTGADPAAVIYDAFEAAKARNIDVLLADTAGRLQNQEGLMRELQKIVRVAGQLDETAPHEKMLVLDASQGQNALNQALQFHEAVGLTGITITKLDGGGRGGILLAIADKLEIPFRFIGIGEGAEDMDVFDSNEFVDALIDSRNDDAEPEGSLHTTS